MCMMTVAYDEELGGRIIMENVVALSVNDKGICLAGLLDDPIMLDDVRVARIDFRRGRTYLVRKAGQ